MLNEIHAISKEVSEVLQPIKNFGINMLNILKNINVSFIGRYSFSLDTFSIHFVS